MPPSESGIRNKVPGSRLHHDVWKPVICALNGMVVGGGLHQVADSDLIIAAEHAELLDTHCMVGNVFAMEPVALLRRMPLSMVMQLGLHDEERADLRAARVRHRAGQRGRSRRSS